MKRCKKITCEFNNQVPVAHPHYSKITIHHHKTVQNHEQTHTEEEWINKHHCGASDPWAHPFDISSGNVPSCACECEHVSTEAKDHEQLFKGFLEKFQQNKAHGVDSTGMFYVKHRSGRHLRKHGVDIHTADR
jgi:hypothetical protein